MSMDIIHLYFMSILCNKKNKKEATEATTLAGSEKPAVVSSRVAAGPERSIVCTETASSSGSQRSCAAIGQSWKEGGGLSTSLPSPPPPPASSPCERTERCGDNRTQSRRRLQGCSAPHPPSHRCTEAPGGATASLSGSPGPSMRPGPSPVLSSSLGG